MFDVHPRPTERTRREQAPCCGPPTSAAQGHVVPLQVTLAFLAKALLATCLTLTSGCRRSPTAGDREAAARVERPPRVRPDYSGVTLPPNIAPLNFTVQEPGDAFSVEIAGAESPPLIVNSATRNVRIPANAWRSLLEQAMGKTIRITVYARAPSGQWCRFTPIENTVAPEPIDGVLVYRFMNPIYNYWDNIGIYQRDLTTFDRSLILHGRSFNHGCTNCHSFSQNSPDTLTIGIRTSDYGSATILSQDGAVSKIGSKWGYTAWHPNGQLAAYSLNKVRQFFHAVGPEVRDVVDLDSDIVVYRIGSSEAFTAPAIANPDLLESYPTWSPDGRTLFFCAAPFPWQNRSKMPPDNYKDVRYSLMRVSYDPDNDSWGTPETVVSGEQTGKSILLPRVSPDGRFVLFCMCEYGCFPIYQPSSDLYMLDVATGEHRRLGINSDQSESWHSWSSNSRWIVFTSKRRDGLLSRPYFAYVDSDGNVRKPFVLPCADPDYLDETLKGFTVPELVTGPVRANPRRIARAVRSSKKLALKLPEVSMTAAKKKASPGEPSQQEPPWQPERE